MSADERRAERLSSLKEACLGLIGETGVASITAEGVSGRAGLTKRYFYESFSDRDALLYAVMDEFFTDVRAEMLDALAGGGGTPAYRAHTIARILIETLERDRRRARLYIESAGQPTLRTRREQAYAAFVDLLLDMVSSGPDKDGGRTLNSSTEQRRTVAALIVVAGTTQAAISWLQGNFELQRQNVIDEIARMIIAAVRPAEGS
jgi:AcrR family transcriptional regulator